MEPLHALTAYSNLAATTVLYIDGLQRRIAHAMVTQNTQCVQSVRTGTDSVIDMLSNGQRAAE